MIAKMYSLDIDNLNKTQRQYIAQLKGQAKVVFEALLTFEGEPKLATEVDEVSGPSLVTKQDTLRVTLYYIIIFKGKGIVKAHEPRRNEDTDVSEVNAFEDMFTSDGELK